MCASIYIGDKCCESVSDVDLDTSKATYGEWIEGEGGDIALMRDRDTNKVAGAFLPLYAKTLVIGGDNFETITIDLETGEVTRG